MVCLSIICILFILQETTKNRIQENIRERFQGSQAAFRHLQDLRKQFVVDAINNLTTSNAQFRSILSTASVSSDELGLEKREEDGDLLTDANLRLNSLLPFLPMYREFDIFIVANADGNLLFSKAATQRSGDDISDLPLFEQFGENDEAEDIWFSNTRDVARFLMPSNPQNAAYHVIAEPVQFRNEFHGAVICGKRIDENTLAIIEGITGTELALYSARGIQVSTLTPQKNQKLDLHLKSEIFDKNGAISEVELDNEIFLSMRFPILARIDLETGGFIVLSSFTRAIKFLTRLRLSFLVVGGIILCVAVGISFLLARGITKSVKQLARAAKEIGTGNLETMIEIHTGDEIENLGNAFNDMVKGLKERDFIKRTFERYVSPKVAAEIIKNPDMLRLGGQKKTVTIFFTDIGNFTTLSENLTPEEVVTHLNQYFEGMTSAILDYDGTINQFQGDAIFAFWGAPIDQEDHALRACRSALKCRDFLRELEKMWTAAGLSARTYRFGLNTGEVIVGNVGSSSRFEYTLIGDDVNLASRLEAANKYYGTQIFISDQTYALIKDRLIAREIDLIRVVGRSKPVRVYELVAEKDNLDPEQARILKFFEVGLNAYRNRQWETAVSHFEQVLHIDPQDTPSNIYIQRCHEYRQTPPPMDWDGVHELQAK
jgi:adenylate cyclase